MSIKIMTLAWSTQLPSTDKFVLLALADNSNDEGHCWPSVPTIASKCGIEPRSVTRVLERLESSGHLTRHERPGRSNTYTVHPRLKVTPDFKSPLTESQATPDIGSPPPLTLSQGTPDFKSPITIIEPSVEPSRNHQVGARAPRSPTATRLPDDFELTPKRRAVAEAEKADPDREFANFTDHWRSASGAKARKHDWDATWRIWCRRSADFRPRGPPGGVNGSAPERTWRPPPDEDEHAGI